MRILLVAMNSIHFVRWTDQLKDASHEVFWFDILDGGRAARLPWVKQITGWKQKFPKFKGRYFFKKYFPRLYKNLSPLFEYNTEKEFEKVLREVKPDIVHSIVLYISCYPILNVMQKYKHIPWVYSSWGSDLFYYKDIPKIKKQILRTLPSIDYLITDCKRDINIAQSLGFSGEVLGTFPGGGGFDYSIYDSYIKPLKDRNIVLVKGYQGRSGRAIQVLKALQSISDDLKAYKVIVFGTDDEVGKFISDHDLANNLEIESFSRRNFLSHEKILELMGASLIYIGNSNSDGMPNTLLEAIAQGAFPIQSNPGGATEEVITHRKNGLLINDCEDSDEIARLILEALGDFVLITSAYKMNQHSVKPLFERSVIKQKVINAYNSVMIN